MSKPQKNPKTSIKSQPSWETHNFTWGSKLTMFFLFKGLRIKIDHPRVMTTPKIFHGCSLPPTTYQAMKTLFLTRCSHQLPTKPWQLLFLPRCSTTYQPITTLFLIRCSLSPTTYQAMTTLFLTRCSLPPTTYQAMTTLSLPLTTYQAMTTLFLTRCSTTYQAMATLSLPPTTYQAIIILSLSLSLIDDCSLHTWKSFCSGSMEHSSHAPASQLVCSAHLVVALFLVGPPLPPQLPLLLLLLVRSTPCLLSNKFGCSLVSQTDKPSKAQKMKMKKKKKQQQ